MSVGRLLSASEIAPPRPVVERAFVTAIKRFLTCVNSEVLIVYSLRSGNRAIGGEVDHATTESAGLVREALGRRSRRRYDGCRGHDR